MGQKFNILQDSKIIRQSPRFTLLVISCDKQHVDELPARGEAKKFNIVMHENFQAGKEYMENSGQDDSIQGVMLDMPLKLTADEKTENIKNSQNLYKVQGYFKEKYKHLPIAIHGPGEICDVIKKTFGDDSFLVYEHFHDIFKYFRTELENKEKGITTKYKIAFDIVSQSHFPKNTETNLKKLLLEIGEVREHDKNIDFVSIGGKARNIVEDVLKALHSIDKEMVPLEYLQEKIPFDPIMKHLMKQEKEGRPRTNIKQIAYVAPTSYIRSLFYFLYYSLSNLTEHSEPLWHPTSKHKPTYYTYLAWQNGLLDLLMWVKYIAERKKKEASNA